MFTSKRLCLVGLNINTVAAITTTKYLPGHQSMMNSVTSLLLMSAFCIPGSFSEDSENRIKRSISGDGVKLCGNQLVGMLSLICSLNFDTGHTDTRPQTYYKNIFNIFCSQVPFNIWWLSTVNATEKKEKSLHWFRLGWSRRKVCAWFLSRDLVMCMFLG